MDDGTPEVESYSVIAPGQGLFFVPSINVRCDPETDYESAEAMADAELEALQAEEGIELLDRHGELLLDQYPVEGALLRWEAEGQELFQRRHYIIIDGAAHTLVLTFTDETGVGSHPVGEGLLRGFRPGQEIVWQ